MASIATAADETAAERHRRQRIAILANLGLAAFLTSIAADGDEILQLYASQVFKLSPGEIGTAISLTLLTIPLQIVAIAWIAAYGRLTMLRIGYLVRLALAPFLFAFPALFQADHLLGLLTFCVWLLLINSAHAISFNLAWPPLVGDITVPGERGRFLGLIRFFNRSVSIAAIGGFALLVGTEMNEIEYFLLVLLVTAYALNSWIQAMRLDPPDHRAKIEPSESLRQLPSNLRLLWSNLAFRRFLICVLISRFIDLPLYVLYAQDAFGFSAQQVSALVAVDSIFSLVTLILWGRLVDRVGSATALTVSSLLVTGLLAMLFFISPRDSTPVLGQLSGSQLMFSLIVVLISAAIVGIMISLQTAAYDVIEERFSVLGFAIFSFTIDAGYFVYRFLSGWALEISGSLPEISFGAVHVDGYKVYLQIALVATIALFLVKPFRTETAAIPTGQERRDDD